MAVRRPEFWRELAARVRERFTGDLTYAANWDAEFETISWWDAVDNVGVDAFWPLLDADSEPLTRSGCDRRMAGIRDRLLAVAARFDRPVTLTEIGYKSATGAAYEPWQWHDNQMPDPEGQALIYRCIRDAFAPAAGAGLDGVYFWVWYTAAAWGGPDNSDFTPRGKPAEGVLRGWFGAR